ncbi:MAG: 6-pyruvoyl trahydropterin synthase family protein [Rhodomicrobium sp.]
MTRIYKEFTFEAGHFLPSAPPGHPNSRLHGHSFLVRVSVEGEPDPKTGLIVHFEDFGARLASVKDKLDHRFLNEIDGLQMPTLERIAAWIWRELAEALPALAEVQVSRPSCHEGCIYTGR